MERQEGANGDTSLSNLKTQLLLQCALPSKTEPVHGGEFVFLANGRFSISTGVLLPHTPDVFNLHSSPFSYEPGAQAPEFSRLLKETFGGDHSAIRRHLLWMGAELIGAHDLQKAYVLTGQPGSGKGTLMKIGTALLGASQVAGLSLDQLTKDFTLSPLIGKSVCRINDVREIGRATSVAVQRLLAIVGGDQVMIDRKNQVPWVGTLPVLFTLESNETIRMPDSSGAIIRRLVTNKTVGSREAAMDPGLADRIIQREMPGVLNMVLDVVEGVYGVWPETDDSLEAKEEMRRASQPLRVWMEERGVVEGELLSIERDVAYHDYHNWALEGGVRNIMDKSWFVRAVRALLPGVGKPVRRGARGEQVWWFEGIGFSDGAS
jgi:putative DNA primase/helicase